MKKIINDKVFNNSSVAVWCYYKYEILPIKKALDKYQEGVLACEGSEKERYMNVYLDLLEIRDNPIEDLPDQCIKFVQQDGIFYPIASDRVYRPDQRQETNAVVFDSAFKEFKPKSLRRK